MNFESPPALLQTSTNRPEEILHFCDESLMRTSTTCNPLSPCIKSPTALITSGEVTCIIPFENLRYSDERSSLEEGALSDVNLGVVEELQTLSEACATLVDRTAAWDHASYQQQGRNHLFTRKQVCRNLHTDSVKPLAKEEEHAPFLKSEGRTSDDYFHSGGELKPVAPTINRFNFAEGGRVNDLSAVAICYSHINKVSVQPDESDQSPSLLQTDVVEQRIFQQGYVRESAKDIKNHHPIGLEITRGSRCGQVFEGESNFSQACCADPEIKHRRLAEYFYPNYREGTPVLDKKYSKDLPSSSCSLAQWNKSKISSCQSNLTDLQRLRKDTSVGDHSSQFILRLISSINKVGKLVREICVACQDIQILSKELKQNGRCKEMGCSNSKPKSKENDNKRDRRKQRKNQYEFDGVNAAENHLFDESQEDTPYMLSPAKYLEVEKSAENLFDENGNGPLTSKKSVENLFDENRNAPPTSKVPPKDSENFSMFGSVLTEEVWTQAMAQLKEIAGQQRVHGSALAPLGAASDEEPEIDASDIGIELQDDSQKRPRVDKYIEVEHVDDPLQKSDHRARDDRLGLNDSFATLRDDFGNSDDICETGDDNVRKNGLFKMTEAQSELIVEKERSFCDVVENSNVDACAPEVIKKLHSQECIEQLQNAANGFTPTTKVEYFTHLSDAIFADAMLALFFGRPSNGILENIEGEEYWINSMITWSSLSSLNTSLHLGLVEDCLQQKVPF